MKSFTLFTIGKIRTESSENMPGRLTISFPIAAILSILSIWGFYSLSFNDISASYFFVSLIALLLFFGCFAVFMLIGNRVFKRYLLYSIPFAFVFSLAYAVGTNICYDDSHTASISLQFFFAALSITPIVSILIAYLFKILSNDTAFRTSVQLPKFLKCIIQFIFESKYTFIKILFIILLVWSPIYFASFPGNYTYDTVYQTSYLVTDSPINSKHPVLHTLLLSIPMQISHELTGTYVYGVAFHTLIQFIIMASIFSYCCFWLSRKCDGFFCKILAFIALIFFCIYPGHLFYSITITKDVIFSGLFTICLIKLYDLSESPAKYLSEWKSVLSLIAVLLLTFLFRNNAVFGFIVFIPLFIALMIRYKYKFRIILISLIPVLLFFIITIPVYSLFGVAKGSIVEAFSVPAAQLSYTCLEDKGSLTIEETEYIDRLIPDWNKYNPTIADSIKNTMSANMISQNPIEFLQHYFSIGFKNPECYLTAFLRLNVGYWYPSSNYAPAEYDDTENYLRLMSPYCWNMKSNGSKYPEDKFIGIERASLAPALENFYRVASQERIGRFIPIIPMLLSIGFLFWTWLFQGAITILRKDYSFLLLTGFILGYWITLLFAPVSIYRYGYMFLTSVPVLLACLLLRGAKPSIVSHDEMG